MGKPDVKTRLKEFLLRRFTNFQEKTHKFQNLRKCTFRKKTILFPPTDRRL